MGIVILYREITLTGNQLAFRYTAAALGRCTAQGVFSSPGASWLDPLASQQHGASAWEHFQSLSEADAGHLPLLRQGGWTR